MSELLPTVTVITRVIRETPGITTLVFDREMVFNPGQFVMVWVPGRDEVPMALSTGTSITVQEVGDATRELCALSEGAKIGIRGPFGNGFSPRGRTLAVAGGVGAAPLLSCALKGKVETFLLGARTASELLFCDRLEECTELATATDDGSAGHHGRVGDLMAGRDLHGYQSILVCGPERMMEAVFHTLRQEGISARGQFSLHRYMKCGVGVCGSCCMDPGGLRVCKDGPVFPGDRLNGGEFGKYARDASGRKKNV
ncbi:dihydroorotate dehydrogenase electron transfer subunit [Methanolinea mesophila]|uniref:dihydroorotate dehydrogenase electron transfer subunit n=1 Tax=Methanolinea mesophila TaxID=547055 RepID=UPI001AE322AC|nr:dihydroorotate dehydrogenase electron transfer subunit [Methanolinea mesophila]MBP1929842.1 dihydroorotate dehydrogenase electron transfer subunit [Methanolinea mesophila]